MMDPVSKSVGALPPNVVAGFPRYSGRYVVIKILHEPDLRGALPDETWNVLCIDRQRNILLPRYDALGVHGRQGPGLTGEEMGAPKVVVHG